MSQQLQLYKGLKSEYEDKKDKIANGGLVITKNDNNSKVGNLYINDSGAHVQLSSDEAVVNVEKQDNELILRKMNGSTSSILTVDTELKNSTNPVQNKVINTKFQVTDNKVEEQNAKINILIGEDENKSIRDISIEVLAEQLIPEDANESLDTLKEIADWIQDHPGDAAAMNTAIQNNTDAINDMKLDITILSVQSDWELDNDQSHAFILNKPSIRSGKGEKSIVIDNESVAYSEKSISIGDNTIAGLKGFYYKAVDKTNKIIYLTKNRLHDGSNYYYLVLEVLSGYYFTADIENWGFGGTWQGSAATSWENGALKRSADKAGATLWSPKPSNVDAAKADYVLLRVKVEGATKDSTVIVQVHVVGGETPGWKPYSVPLTEDILAEDGYYEVKLDLTGINTGKINQIGITQWYDETTGAAETQTFYMDSCEIWDLDDDIGAFKKLKEDLYYSENAVGKLLSVCNNTKFESSLRITKVEPGKIYYELIDEDNDPFETVKEITELGIDDFSIWCHDCYDEGVVDLGFGAHAEGDGSKATNRAAHSEGRDTHAYGQYAHTEGRETKAGYAAHAEGYGTVASSGCQHVQGRYNTEDAEGKYAHIVGNGTSDTKCSNAHTLDWDGNAWFAGDVYVGGTNQDNADVLLRKSSFTFDAETGTLTLTL